MICGHKLHNRDIYEFQDVNISNLLNLIFSPSQPVPCSPSQPACRFPVLHLNLRTGSLFSMQNLIKSNQLNVSHIHRQPLPSNSPEIPCCPSKGIPILSERLRLVEVINFASATYWRMCKSCVTYILTYCSPSQPAHRFPVFFLSFLSWTEFILTRELYTESKEKSVAKDEDDSDSHIILGPQRSSFNSGCHVSGGDTRRNLSPRRDRDRADM